MRNVRLAANHGVLTNPTKLVDPRSPREVYTIVDHDVPGDHDVVRDDDVITQVTVVAHVRIGH